MAKAVDAISEGRMSYSKAREVFGIPESTLRDHVKGRIESGASIGRPPVLPSKVEDTIAEKVMVAAQKGFGISRQQLLQKTGQIARSLKIATPFKHDIPGKDWWEGFKKRHPEITLRKPEKLAQSRVRMMNRDVVANYFCILNKTLEELDLFNKPKLIWNMDETGLMLEHNPSTVCARKGSKAVLSRTSNSRESVTAVVTVNAAGRSLPPLLIVRGKTQKAMNAWAVSEGPVGALWTYQSRAWMEDVLGQEWFFKVFLPNIGPERPQLLILDSHRSHETLGLLEAASKEQITLLAFPPHTTHYLQPLDRSVFKSVKSNYNKVCSEFMNSSQETVNKRTWPDIVRQTFDQSITANNIQNGFRACGVYPFNANAVSEEAYAPSDSFAPNPVSPNDVITNNVENLAALESPLLFQPEIHLPSTEPFPTHDTDVIETLTFDLPFSEEADFPPGTQILSSANSILESLANGASYDQEISLHFDPPAASSTPVRNKTKKSKLITTSRILTSSQIINEKKMEEQSKIEKKNELEIRKENRKRKAELKKQMKSKKSTKDVCAVCGMKFPQTGEKDVLWVQCDQCNIWIHAACLDQNVDLNKSFFCKSCRA